MRGHQAFLVAAQRFHVKFQSCMSGSWEQRDSWGSSGVGQWIPGAACVRVCFDRQTVCST